MANLDRELMKKSPALAAAKALLQGEFLPAKPKRKPLLLDEFLATPQSELVLVSKFLPANKLEALRHAMRVAKKFVFDDDATRYAGKMIKQHPEAIAFDQEFAIPPFPTMYLEYHAAPLFAALGQEDKLDWVTGDESVGYLWLGPRVYVMSRSRQPPQDKRGKVYSPVTLMPIAYRLNKAFTVQEELDAVAVMENSRAMLDVLYWGSQYEAVKGTHAERALRAHHSFEWLYLKDQIATMKSLPDLLVAAAGDLRNIIAFTLFLNRTSQVQLQDEVGFHRTMIHTKPVTLVKHRVVHLKLDPKPLLLKVYGSGGVWRREHEVRGHFCHDQDARASEHHPAGHDWREYGVNQWRCMTCGGLKWHRKAHRRGSREKGQVVTDYEVGK